MARAFHGWAMVAACFVMALFAWGIGFYGMGVYFVLLRDVRGIAPGALSAAMTAYFLFGALAIAALGPAWERLGPRRAVAAGGIAFALGLVVLSGAQGIVQTLAAYALLALGWAASSSAAINMTLAPWFERRRGWALSLALTGASASGVIFPPLLVLAFERFGFAAGLRALALAVLLALLALARYVVVARPEAIGQHADGGTAPARTPDGPSPLWSARSAFAAPAFWAITVAFALGLTVQVAFLTHQIAITEPWLGRAGAALGVSLAGAAAIVGRLATGALLDRWPRRLIASANFLLLAAALAALCVVRSPWPVLAACTLYGLGLGNLVSLPGLLVQHAFAPAQFVRVTGLVVGICQLVYSAGPALFGLVYQARGSYVPALAAGAGVLAACALIILTGKPRRAAA